MPVAWPWSTPSRRSGLHSDWKRTHDTNGRFLFGGGGVALPREPAATASPHPEHTREVVVNDCEQPPLQRGLWKDGS